MKGRPGAGFGRVVIESPWRVASFFPVLFFTKRIGKGGGWKE